MRHAPVPHHLSNAGLIVIVRSDFFAPLGMAQVKDEPLGILRRRSGGNMLYNQEGEVMRGAVNVYLIFYGRKWRPEKRFKIENFVRNMDKSSYFSIIKNYYDKEGNVTGPLILKPSTWLDYEYGKHLTFNDLEKLVHQVYPTIDYNGIYTILTDSETEFSHNNNRRFCINFCGFHTIFQQNRKLAFVGDCGKCVSCAPFADSPNFDRSTDGIINILAHEIVETLSNPDTRRPTWIDSDKLENADKCSFNMGSDKHVDAAGNRYNLNVGDLKYYVQTYWSLIKNTCVLSD